MILKHRDKELLRFEWTGDTRIRILSINDAERRFLPLEFGDLRLHGDVEDLRHSLEDWLDFPYELTESLTLRLAQQKRFRFKKHRHYNWPEERRAVLTGFLQKRISEVCAFGKEADRKLQQSLAIDTINSKGNVGVKSSSDSILNVSEQKVVKLILRNSATTESEIANQLGITVRQAERIIAALKKKAGLMRRGTDKVGEWYFD